MGLDDGVSGVVSEATGDGKQKKKGLPSGGPLATGGNYLQLEGRYLVGRATEILPPSGAAPQVQTTCPLAA